MGSDITIPPGSTSLHEINQSIDGKHRTAERQCPQDLPRQARSSATIQYEQGPIKDARLRHELFPLGKTVARIGRERNRAEHPDHEQPEGKIQRILDPWTHPLDPAHDQGENDQNNDGMFLETKKERKKTRAGDRDHDIPLESPEQCMTGGTTSSSQDRPGHRVDRWRPLAIHIVSAVSR